MHILIYIKFPYYQRWAAISIQNIPLFITFTSWYELEETKIFSKEHTIELFIYSGASPITIEMTPTLDVVFALICCSLAVLIIIITLCWFFHIVCGINYLLGRQNPAPAVLYRHRPGSRITHVTHIDHPLTLRPTLASENRSTPDITSK